MPGSGAGHATAVNSTALYIEVAMRMELWCSHNNSNNWTAIRWAPYMPFTVNVSLGLSHQDKQICDSCKCDLTMWFFMHANCPWLPGTKMCPKEHPVPFLASKRFGVFTSVYILLLLGVNFVSFVPKLLWYSYAIVAFFHTSKLLPHLSNNFSGFQVFSSFFFLKGILFIFQVVFKSNS